MSNITIRRVSGEQIEELIEDSQFLRNYAFEPTPPLVSKEEWVKKLNFLKDATHTVLYENGKPVAGSASSPMTENIRGKIYPAGGIWGVATHPAARRKGYARQALAELLKIIREDGTPFSVLYPFRESFYQRLGYVAFPRARKVRFPTSAFLPLLKQDLKGEVELLSIAEGLEVYRDFLKQHQTRLHGMALFSDHTAARMGESNWYWLAVARVEGEVVGVMTYQLKGEEPFDMSVPRFYYADQHGKYLLLEWFARHADQAKEVELKLPPGEYAETWLADLYPNYSSFEAPMGRVLDVAAIGGMEVGPGRFSAKILDPFCPWNEGIYQFESVEGNLQVSHARQAECELTIQGLTALVYGTHEPASFEFRGWGNPAPALQATLQTMFPPRLPYLHEVF